MNVQQTEVDATEVHDEHRIDGSHIKGDSHIKPAPSPLLLVYVETWESAEKLRMEMNNRIRCWYRDTFPKEEWKGMDFSDDNLKNIDDLPNDLRQFSADIKQLEKDALKWCKRELNGSKKENIEGNPLWLGFMKDVRGIAEKSACRLLKSLGDLNRFPSPAHLWSYCGMDGPGWKKRPHNWTLPKVCWNIASGFVKSKQKDKPSEGYRLVYEQRKAYEQTRPWCGACRYAEEKKAFDAGELVREKCIDKHIDNKARRYTVKMFLKDLWVESRHIS